MAVTGRFLNAIKKEHRNVCRDIEKLNLEYEKLGLLKIEQGFLFE